MKSIFFTLLFCVSSLQVGALDVAFLGESYSDEFNEAGFNGDVLARLFKLINEMKPSAVFFTGDMTLGLKGNPQDQDELLTHRLYHPSTGIIDGFDKDMWPREGYVYDSESFQEGLNRFFTIKEKNLNQNIAFYPLIGPHEAFGSDSIARVKSTFKVQNEVPAEISSLAYTVALKDTLFLLFSTATYDAIKKTTFNHQISKQLMAWISSTLEKNRKQYRHLFVVGNEPAFSTTSSSGDYRGLDANPEVRDEFWQILIKNNVTAYICSQEHLYDRSNRNGVWQIISGGAGAALYKRSFDKAFYHFLLLSIPDEGAPILRVFDTQGILDDAFELVPTSYPLYQLRIS